MTDQKPAHLIAEARSARPFSVDTKDWHELSAFLADRPAAFSTWCDLVEHLGRCGDDRAPMHAPSVADPQLVLPKHLDRAQRQAQLADITAAMIASLNPAERERCIEVARSLVADADSLRRRRRIQLRRIHRIHHGDLKDHAAAEVIAHNLARRFGTTIIGTGNKSLDSLIDEALLYCARTAAKRSTPSSRSIRRDLSPG